jgi:hypothetical protein
MFSVLRRSRMFIACDYFIDGRSFKSEICAEEWEHRTPKGVPERRADL